MILEGQLDSNDVNLIAAVSAFGQLVTAAFAGLIAFFAWRASTRFAKSQAAFMYLTHVNQSNFSTMDLYLRDPEFASYIKQNTPGGNVLVTYRIWTLLNIAEINWRMVGLGSLEKKHLDDEVAWVAGQLRGLPEDSAKSILSSGYHIKFQKFLLDAVAAQGGFNARIQKD